MNPIVDVLTRPNLNRLGKRQPEIYGREMLADVEAEYRRITEELGLDIEFRHHFFVSRVAAGVICGFGTQGYVPAIRRLARLIGSPGTSPVRRAFLAGLIDAGIQAARHVSARIILAPISPIIC